MWQIEVDGAIHFILALHWSGGLEISSSTLEFRLSFETAIDEIEERVIEAVLLEGYDSSKLRKVD